MKKKPEIFVWIGGTKGGYEKILLDLCGAFRKYGGITPVIGVFKKDPQVKFLQKVFPPLFPTSKLHGFNQAWISIRLGFSSFLDRFDICIGDFASKRKSLTVSVVSADIHQVNKNSRLITKTAYIPIVMVQEPSFKKSKLHIANTNPSFRYLKRIGRKNILHSHHFVDTKLFKPGKKKKSDKFRLLFVGRDDPIKNLSSLKAAVKGMKDVELDIVGVRGDNKGNIRYHAWCSQDQLVKFYQQADLAVMPSLYESFGLIALEALACETPVLLSKYANSREELKDFVYVCDTSSTSIAEVITTIKANYKKAKSKAKNGIKTILKTYEKEKVLKEQVNFILNYYKSH